SSSTSALPTRSAWSLSRRRSRASTRPSSSCPRRCGICSAPTRAPVRAAPRNARRRTLAYAATGARYTAAHMRAFAIATLRLGLLGLVACAKKASRDLDFDLVRVTSDARLRTDTIGVGKHEEIATFVLV